MTIRALSAPNIALIKYWGNRNEALRLPMADSLSITLDKPVVEVSVTPSDLFSARSFETDGSIRELSDKESARLEKHFLLSKGYLTSIGTTGLPRSISVEIRSQVPKGVGLASSAAVFSALGKAYSAFAPGISDRDVSILARLGSGSASRSTFGGYVAMVRGAGIDAGSSYAQQIAPAEHWKLWDIVIAPFVEEKKTGSTEGHALAPTSPLYEKRIREIADRQERCIEAVLKKDFPALQKVAEEDCLDMHEVMRTSTPPLDYLSSETHRIIKKLIELRSQKELSVLYTMDAGPTVHLICEESALEDIRAFAHEQENCSVFEARVGGGSTLL